MVLPPVRMTRPSASTTPGLARNRAWYRTWRPSRRPRWCPPCRPWCRPCRSKGRAEKRRRPAPSCLRAGPGPHQPAPHRGTPNSPRPGRTARAAASRCADRGARHCWQRCRGRWRRRAGGARKGGISPHQLARNWMPRRRKVQPPRPTTARQS